MELENREAKMYLACVSERETTQNRLSYQNLKPQQRREARFTEVSLQRPYPAYVSGICRRPGNNEMMRGAYERHPVLAWLDDVENALVRLPEPVYLARITNGRSYTGIGSTKALTDVPPALLDGIRRSRPFRYVAFLEPHGTLAGQEGHSELSTTPAPGEAESTLQEG